MADQDSPLRTSRGAPTLFDQVQVASQLSSEDRYNLTNPNEGEFKKGLRTGAAGLSASSFANQALSQERAGDPQWEASRDSAFDVLEGAAPYAARVSSLRDVGSLADAGDYAANTIGQGVMSMAPVLATALVTRGRGKIGTGAAYAGGALTAYGQEKGEAALGQYGDETLAATDVVDRDNAATAKGVVNAALESVVPGGLATSVLRRPFTSALKEVGKDTLKEGATETAQTITGMAADQYLDPGREVDGMELLDAFAGGALTGGAVSGATRLPTAAASSLASAITPKEGTGGDPTPAATPAPTMTERANGTPYEAFIKAGWTDEQLVEHGYMAPNTPEPSEPPGFADSIIQRMGEASMSATGPADFLRKAFNDNAESEAEPLIVGDNDPTLAGATPEETEANLLRADQLRAERAAAFAQRLIDDPKTPDPVKQKIAGMGGAYADSANQQFLGRTFLKQQAETKIESTVNDVIELGSKLAGAVKGKFTKQNLQDTTSTGENKVAEFPMDRARRSARQQVEDVLDDDARAMLERQEVAVVDAEARVERARRLNNGRMAEIVRVARTMPEDVFMENPVYENMTPFERKAFHEIMRPEQDLFEERQILEAMRADLTRGGQAGDRIVKKNLQDTTPTEQAVFNKLVFDQLTDEAKASPEVRKRLPELANTMLAFAARTGELDDGDISTLTDIYSSFSLFQDIDALSEQLTTYASLPRPGDSFLARAKRVNTAQRDIVKPNSFLYSALTSEAKDTLTSSGLKQLAKLIDNFAAIDADDDHGSHALSDEGKSAMETRVSAWLAKQLEGTADEATKTALKARVEARLARNLKAAPGDRGSEVLAGLATAFGSEDNARAVLDYYASQNRAGLGTKVDTKGEGMTQQDAQELTGSYRDPNPNRPFLRGRDDELAKTQLKDTGGTNSRIGTLAEYTKLKGESMSARAKGVRADLVKRIEDEARRDTASVKQKIAIMEMQESLTRDQRNELLRLKALKTESRPNLKLLRDELKAQDEAATLAKKEGRNASEARLSLYDTVLREETDTMASDENVAKFRRLLDQMPDPTIGTEDERAEKKQRVADIKATAIGFKRKGQSLPMYLSAESMVHSAKNKGTVAQRFADAVASVLARGDIEGLAGEISPDTIIKRGKNGSQHVLYSDIAPTQSRAKSEGDKPRSVARKKKGPMDDVDQADKEELEYLENQLERDYPLPDYEDFAQNHAAEENEAGRYAEEGAVAVAYEERKLEVLIERRNAASVAIHPKIAEKVERQIAASRTRLNELINQYEARYFEDDTGLPVGVEKRGAKPEKAAAPAKNAERVILPKNSPYAAKDQAKSDRATKFIGRGAPGSSTAAYAKAWGDRANTGEYTEEDVVFISVNGNRPGAISPPWGEIKKAMSAGATIVTDKEGDRARPFNTGERAVAEFLTNNGYFEAKPGEWTRAYDYDNATGQKRYAPLGGAKPRIVKNTFVGAKTDPEGAARAGAKIDEGAAADIVWSVLGWFRGPDGKLRKEIQSPVLKSRLRVIARHGATTHNIQLSQLLHGIAEFAGLAPLLKGYTLEVSNDVPSDDDIQSLNMGAFAPADKQITVNLASITASVVYRNMNHEAFMKSLVNGNSVPEPSDLDAITKYVAQLEGVDKTAEELRAEVIDEIVATMLHEFQHAVQHVEGFEGGGTPVAAVVAKFGDPSATIENLTQEMVDSAFEAMRAHYGPDADLEDIANRLYHDIIGEAEAFDVERRMKLSPEEARRLRPALDSGGQRFIRSIIAAGASMKLSSTMDPLDDGPDGVSVMDRETKDKIKAEILRIRGPEIKVLFGQFAQIGASGEFSMDDDKTNRLIKIAMNAINPTSVAWHESLHDFMAMLGGSKEERQLKRDLLDAAQAPQVMTKLRELLKAHPKAITQIENDKEERLAYMYQFWAEGKLSLGPTGTNIFTRIAKFLREALGVLSQDEKITKLLDALHTGKFANQNLVSAVLEDLKAETIGDKVAKVAGPIYEGSSKLFTAATDRLRDTNVDALGELADLFHREPGHEAGGLPFLQSRSQQVGKYLNKLQGVLDKTTATERRAALENMLSMKAPSSKLERDVAALLEDIRVYMDKAGVKRFDEANKEWVPMGVIKNYFPRNWDKNVIRNRESDFITLLTQHVGAEQARATYSAIVNGDGAPELQENKHSLGFTPFMQAVQDRRLNFINENNAALFTPFMNKDMLDALTTYIQQAVHRGEYAKTFGNAGEVIQAKLKKAKKQGASNEDLDMATNAVMAMEGTLGHDFNPRLKELMSGIMTYQNIVLLPLALFSSLIDPLGVAMRSNDMKEAFHAFSTGLQSIAKDLAGAVTGNKKVDEREEMAKLLGIIDEQNMLEAMGHVYNSMHMSKFMKKVNSAFFRGNGMETWNRGMRVAATSAAQRFIVRNTSNDRYMKELGITKADVFEQKDGTIALTQEQLVAAGATPAEAAKIEKRIQAAVFKFVDGAVLRPNAAHRPIWGSDPRFQLIFHLKQFTYSFHNTILKRVGEEMKHGNAAPVLILLSYVPFMLASDIMKGSLMGTLQNGTDLYDVVSRSVARSGIMGIGTFRADAAEDVGHGSIPGSSFLGPTFDHLMTILDGIFGNTSLTSVVERSIPGGAALRGVI